jgi:hypothetical protein
MKTRWGLAWLIPVLLLVGCGQPNDQAIQHVVIAELIQAEHVPESRVEIRSVRLVGEDEAIVETKVWGPGGRADRWEKVECRVKREAGRWRLVETHKL